MPEPTLPDPGSALSGSPLPEPAARRRATLVGGIAVLLWALLAALTASTGDVPPLQLNAMAFLVGGAVGVAWAVRARGVAGFLAVLRGQPPLAWAIGVGGLFGYHALYFAALNAAPPAEASLIAYLWPLLIVLMAALLPGERLRRGHVAGALLGFAGAGLLIAARDGGVGGTGGLGAALLPGHVLALGCAVLWSAYSVGSRLMGAVPTEAVAGYCLAAAALSLPLHLVFEPTVWPAGAAQWLAVLGLGLGPVGAAFYAWDRGCKRGDIQLLGTLAYAAPVLSTLVLVALGLASATWALGAATALVTLGAVVASRA